jgi:hypothetical protein
MAPAQLRPVRRRSRPVMLLGAGPLPPLIGQGVDSGPNPARTHLRVSPPAARYPGRAPHAVHVRCHRWPRHRRGPLGERRHYLPFHGMAAGTGAGGRRPLGPARNCIPFAPCARILSHGPIFKAVFRLPTTPLRRHRFIVNQTFTKVLAGEGRWANDQWRWAPEPVWRNRRCGGRRKETRWIKSLALVYKQSRAPEL